MVGPEKVMGAWSLWLQAPGWYELRFVTVDLLPVSRQVDYLVKIERVHRHDYQRCITIAGLTVAPAECSRELDIKIHTWREQVRVRVELDCPREIARIVAVHRERGSELESDKVADSSRVRGCDQFVILIPDLPVGSAGESITADPEADLGKFCVVADRKTGTRELDLVELVIEASLYETSRKTGNICAHIDASRDRLGRVVGVCDRFAGKSFQVARIAVDHHPFHPFVKDDPLYRVSLDPILVLPICHRIERGVCREVRAIRADDVERLNVPRTDFKSPGPTEIVLDPAAVVYLPPMIQFITELVTLVVLNLDLRHDGRHIRQEALVDSEVDSCESTALAGSATRSNGEREKVVTIGWNLAATKHSLHVVGEDVELDRPVDNHGVVLPIRIVHPFSATNGWSWHDAEPTLTDVTTVALHVFRATTVDDLGVVHLLIADAVRLADQSGLDVVAIRVRLTGFRNFDGLLDDDLFSSVHVADAVHLANGTRFDLVTVRVVGAEYLDGNHFFSHLSWLVVGSGRVGAASDEAGGEQGDEGQRAHGFYSLWVIVRSFF